MSAAATPRRLGEALRRSPRLRGAPARSPPEKATVSRAIPERRELADHAVGSMASAQPVRLAKHRCVDFGPPRAGVVRGKQVEHAGIVAAGRRDGRLLPDARRHEPRHSAPANPMRWEAARRRDGSWWNTPSTPGAQPSSDKNRRCSVFVSEPNRTVTFASSAWEVELDGHGLPFLREPREEASSMSRSRASPSNGSPSGPRRCASVGHSFRDSTGDAHDWHFRSGARRLRRRHHHAKRAPRRTGHDRDHAGRRPRTGRGGATISRGVHRRSRCHRSRTASDGACDAVAAHGRHRGLVDHLAPARRETRRDKPGRDSVSAPRRSRSCRPASCRRRTLRCPCMPCRYSRRGWYCRNNNRKSRAEKTMRAGPPLRCA